MTTQRPLFDPLAELYERYAAITEDRYRPWLDGALPRSAARAVDLGCGSGRFTSLLADRADRVLAVDISSREIDLARRARGWPSVTYQVRSLLDVTPDADGQFDVVLSVNALFHLYAGTPAEEVLGHVRSLVAPGGTLVVIDVVTPGPRPALWHRWWGAQDATRTLLRRRSLADARAVHALRQHPAWLTHSRAVRPLTRPEFQATCGRLLPGAQFTDTLDPFLCGLRWRQEPPP